MEREEHTLTRALFGIELEEILAVVPHFAAVIS